MSNSYKEQLKITYSPSDFGHVVVLYGGKTSERDVSLKTGKALYEQLSSLGVEVTLFDVGDNFISELTAIQKSDNPFALALVALHGGEGEGGEVQAFLELLNLPYTGCDMTTSAVCMDKVLSKRLADQAGLPVKPFAILDKADESVLFPLGFPQNAVVVKPSADGSSCGVSKVSNASELSKAYDGAKILNGVVMSEPWIIGSEVSVGFVGDFILPAVQMKANHDFYDYDAKYVTGDTQYFCPTLLGDELNDILIDMTRQTIDVFGMTGWGRVDFIVDENNQPWLLEVNTVPGMTSTSILPKAAATLGIEFSALLLSILSHAKRRAKRRAKRAKAH